MVNEYFHAARIETAQDMDTYDDTDDIPITSVAELPAIGEQIEEGKMYGFDGKVYHAVQSHVRMHYHPDDTPALFAVKREDTGSLPWVKNEKVNAGDIRIYNEVEYECIQAHMTLESWTPDNTPTLWKEKSDEVQEWVQPTGAHDAYNIGDRVLFNGKVYESKINANVWSPTGYPAGWLLIN